MKVRGKLLFGFGILLAATVVIAIFGIVNLMTVNTSWSNALEFPNQRYNYLFHVRYEMMDMRRILFAVVHEAGDATLVANRLNEVNTRRTNISAHLNSYRENLNADNDLAPDRATYLLNRATQVEEALDAYFTNVADRVFTEAQGGNGREAYQLVIDGVPALNAIYVQLDYLFNAATARMNVIAVLLSVRNFSLGSAHPA